MLGVSRSQTSHIVVLTAKIYDSNTVRIYSLSKITIREEDRGGRGGIPIQASLCSRSYERSQSASSSNKMQQHVCSVLAREAS